MTRDANDAHTAYHDALDAYRAAKDQSRRMSAKQAELQRQIEVFEREIETQQEALARLLASFGTEAEIDQARQRIGTTKDRTEEVRELLSAIIALSPATSDEVHRLRTAAARAREQLAETLWTPIEKRLRADAKLRRSLIEIYVLAEATRSTELGTASSTPSWAGVLLDVFQEPDADEVSAVFDKVSIHFETTPDEAA